MSYAIGNIIFGLPVTEAARELIAQSTYEGGTLFEVIYTQVGYIPGWCGMLITTINETEDVNFAHLVNTVAYKSTDVQEALDKLEELEKQHPDIYEAMGGHKAIGTYIVWSSS